MSDDPATDGVSPSRAPHYRPTIGGAGTASGTEGAMLHARALRHTGWNLAGILLPLVVGLFAIPVLTRQLGVARFGVLGLAWMLLEYFALFDAGLGRATVRAVAAGRNLLRTRAVGEDAIAARDLMEAVTGAVIIQLVLGIVAGGALIAIAPAAVELLLHPSSELLNESVSAIRLLGATVPVLMLGLALRGMLEAAERFDLSNGIRIPLSIGTFLVPAAVAATGRGLPSIMLALLSLRVLSVIAQWVALARALPGFTWRLPSRWGGVRELLAFGGWVAISNLVSPLLVYADRLVVGALLGAAALGYYTAPFEASLRLLVLPAAAVAALYPMASALMATGDAGRMKALYAGSVRALAGGMIGIAITGVVLAPDILEGWLGSEYARNGSLALRLLCAGVLVNAVVHVPFAFIQASGRPDIMARFHLIELVIHLPVAYLLVQRYGIEGAAGAWALRALLDALLIFGAADRVLGVSFAQLLDGRLPRAAGLAVSLLMVLLVMQWVVGREMLDADTRMRGITIALLALPPLAMHAVASWRWLLTGRERDAMLDALRRR